MGLADVVVGLVGVESLMGGEIFVCLELHLQLRGTNIHWPLWTGAAVSKKGIFALTRIEFQSNTCKRKAPICNVVFRLLPWTESVAGRHQIIELFHSLLYISLMFWFSLKILQLSDIVLKLTCHWRTDVIRFEEPSLCGNVRTLIKTRLTARSFVTVWGRAHRKTSQVLQIRTTLAAAIVRIPKRSTEVTSVGGWLSTNVFPGNPAGVAAELSRTDCAAI